MPRSFRSLLAHADELLADPGESVAKLEVRRASTEKADKKAQACPAILNQHLFESSQKDQADDA